MTKYFLICASKDHVLKGVALGIAQAGHGRKDFMSKPAQGDWIVYYSSKTNLIMVARCKNLPRLVKLKMTNRINLL